MSTVPDRLDTMSGATDPRGRWRRATLATGVGAAVVVALLVGGARLLHGDAGRPLGVSTHTTAGAAVTTPPTSTARTVLPADGERVVRASGRGLARHAFGTAADTVVADLTARFGDPDVATGPTAYHRVRGQRGWYETAGDPISPSWRHRVVSVTCWDTLCVVAGGPRPGALTLRGWELGTSVRWSPTGEAGDAEAPDVRLARTGVRLGDRWREVATAYPGTSVAGGEGASVTVRDLPWPGITDGVGEWRLSGTWDAAHPTRAPRDAVVTRLSAGEGPEPGCC